MTYNSEMTSILLGRIKDQNAACAENTFRTLINPLARVHVGSPLPMNLSIVDIAG